MPRMPLLAYFLLCTCTPLAALPAVSPHSQPSRSFSALPQLLDAHRADVLFATAGSRVGTNFISTVYRECASNLLSLAPLHPLPALPGALHEAAGAAPPPPREEAKVNVSRSGGGGKWRSAVPRWCSS